MLTELLDKDRFNLLQTKKERSQPVLPQTTKQLHSLTPDSKSTTKTRTDLSPEIKVKALSNPLTSNSSNLCRCRVNKLLLLC